MGFRVSGFGDLEVCVWFRNLEIRCRFRDFEICRRFRVLVTCRRLGGFGVCRRFKDLGIFFTISAFAAQGSELGGFKVLFTRFGLV